MPVTLLEAKKNVQDALQMGIIDEFVKNNYLLETIPFDPCVSATGGGATMTYAYTRLITPPTAQFRTINTEYSPGEAAKQRYTTDIAVFGGSYQIDRVIADMGGIVSEIELQSTQKVKAAKALFNDTVINGDSAVDANTFDGLDKAITGSSTEFKPPAPVDLSTSTAVDSNFSAFLDLLDEFLMGLDGVPSCILGNTKMIAKLRAVARRAGMYQITKTDFGNQVEKYGNIPWIDLGAKAGSNESIISTDGTAGTTSLYAIRFGLDGFHAVSMAGVPIIKTWLPDYKTAGAVKTGEVEMNAAVVLKATKAAGVFRDIKVQ